MRLKRKLFARSQNLIRGIKRLAGISLALIVGLTQILSGVASAQVADTEAPVVIHRQAETPGVAGELQTFLARVSDDFEVKEVILYYRQAPSGGFQQIPMRSLLDSIGEYMIAIETDISEYPGLQYYIEAEDTSGNTTSRGFSYAPIILPLDEPAAPSEPVIPVVAPEIAEVPRESSPISGNTGILIGLGALVLLGALAAGGGGSDGGGGDTGGGVVTPTPTPGPTPTDDTVTLTIITDGP